MTPALFRQYLEVAREHGVTSARIVAEGVSCTFTLGEAAQRPQTPEEIESALGGDDDALFASGGL